MHINIHHLSKFYGPIVALDDLSLDIAPGQVVALLGPNGAGKTTLLRCLAGVAGYDRGEILYDREPFRRDRLDQRRRFAFLPDTPFVFPQMTVLRHIGMVVRFYQAERPDLENQVVELLRDFDLLALAESRLGDLSRGQLYKAALVALLAVNPEVWLLDEPLASGMDPRGIAAFKSHSRAAARAGCTFLYSTQILEVAERFSDRVCVLYQGRIHAFGSVDELRPESGTQEVLEALFQQLHEVQP